VFLNGDAIPAPNARGEQVLDDSFLLCFNAHDVPVEFTTPDGTYADEWTAILDTAHPRGDSDLVVEAGRPVSVHPRSVLILRKTD
jgi:isoamylase